MDRAERTAFISFLIHAGLLALAAALAFLSGSAAVLALTWLTATGFAASWLAWAGARLSPRARGVPALPWNLALLLVGVAALWAAVAVLRAPAAPRVSLLPLAIGGALAAAVVLHVISRRGLFVGRESENRGLIAAGLHSRMATFAAALTVAALAGQRMGFALDRAGAVVIAAFVAATGLGILASVAEGLRTGARVQGAFPVRLARPSAPGRRARRGGTLRSRARRIEDALFHPAHRGHAAGVAACALAVVWGLSAVSFVGSGQIGLVSGVGGERAVGPGLHVKAPWPLERAERVEAGEFRRASLGSAEPPVKGGPSWFALKFARFASSIGVPVRESAKAVAPRTEAVFLTGDGRLVAVEAFVHYVVDDPAAFAVAAEDPDAVVARALESAVAAAVAASTFEQVVGAGRADLEGSLTVRLERSLDALGLGVNVQAVRLGRVLRPAGAASSFVSAADVAERIVVEETARSARALSSARVEARRVLSAADGYAAVRRSRAETDAATFLALAPEYRRARDVTETRLYIETMEALLGGVEKRIVGSGVVLEGYDPAAFDQALAPGAGAGTASGR